MEGASPRESLDLSTLSPSERQVLELARSGMTAMELAQQLSLTEATVRTHLSHIYEKLEVRGRVELLARLQGNTASSMDPSLRADASVGRMPALTPAAKAGPWRLILVSAVGAAVGIAAGFALLPATAVSPSLVLLVPLLAGAPLALVIARRPAS